MKKLINLVTLIFFLVTFSNCNKSDEIEIEFDNKSVTEFEEYLQDEMESQNIPAISVLVFKENDILYERYLGKSNLQQNIALVNNHLFLMASVSKVVTATALLQLYEDGLFSLSDRIDDYLPFSVNVPNQSTAITFQMLLTHTSGIADGTALDDQYYYDEDPKVTLRFFLENYLKPEGNFYNASENFHDFEPGTAHEYSNVGSALIGLLVEEISGVDFNTYCKQNIFNPLEMANTSWRLDEISQTIVTPYDYENGNYVAAKNATFTDYPNGGLRSTGKDMFTFLKAFTQSGQSNNTELLSETTINLMIKPQIPTIDNEMGLHVFLMNAENNLWGHDGSEQGAATIMAFNPTTKIGAIILSNQGEANLDEILVEAYKLKL